MVNLTEKQHSMAHSSDLFIHLLMLALDKDPWAGRSIVD